MLAELPAGAHKNPAADRHRSSRKRSGERSIRWSYPRVDLTIAVTAPEVGYEHQRHVPVPITTASSGTASIELTGAREGRDLASVPPRYPS
jgi:hypothetical protein